jgi:protein subunit release factor B
MAANPTRFTGFIPIKRLVIQKTIKDAKVSVSFNVTSADWLPDETRQNLLQLHKPGIAKDGTLTIRSDKTRSQTLNVADCLDRIRAYISEAEQSPSAESLPETIESKRLRLEKAAAERLKAYFA